jgi:hypothetical protein
MILTIFKAKRFRWGKQLIFPPSRFPETDLLSGFESFDRSAILTSMQDAKVVIGLSATDHSMFDSTTLRTEQFSIRT